MSVATRALRLVIAAASLGSLALIGHANAATVTTKVYFRGAGCPAADTWLDTAVSANADDGCGYAGGLPLGEVAGPSPFDFTTKKTFKAVKLDTTKKITGVYAVGGWALVGAGEVVVDLTMTAKTKTGKSINFGETTGTVTKVGAGEASVPFTFSIPASAKGQLLTKITVTVSQHGKNIGWNAYSFSGKSYMNLPTIK